MSSDQVQQVLKQAYDKIQSLMTENRWLEAHRACLEVLQFDPDNIRIIRFKNIIEKKVKNINKNAIKEDLKNLQSLWKEEKYEEYLRHLKELEPYIIDYPPLKDIILKAQSVYQKQVRKQQEAYYRSTIADIQKLMQEQKFQEALRDAEKLRILNVQEKELKNFIAKIRTDWVEMELKKNKHLLESQKYEDILLFYQNLLRIDSKSQKLKKLIESTKNKYMVFRIQEKRELIYKGLEKMKTLYQLQKYQRTMEAAKEILNIDPQNKEARKFFVKAEYKMARSIDKELLIQMRSAQKQMKEQYKKTKKDIIKI